MIILCLIVPPQTRSIDDDEKRRVGRKPDRDRIIIRVRVNRRRDDRTAIIRRDGNEAVNHCEPEVDGPDAATSRGRKPARRCIGSAEVVNLGIVTVENAVSRH